MKQGAYLDTSEPYQPWISLILNYIAEIMDKQEDEGSFQPLNLGFGWVTDVQIEGENSDSKREEATGRTFVE